MEFETISGILATNWGWALAVATAFGAATKTAHALLPKQKKDSLALWLMGAETDENWSQTFCNLFDSIFGSDHLSWKCILRSFAASLLAVLAIWSLLGSSDTLQLRVNTTLELGQVLAIGLAINLLADYISLLETRYLLKVLHKRNEWWLQAAVLLVDLVFSAAIIFAAIWLYIRSPLYQGDIHSFAEVLGAFSIFSVFFYSTFLTSVWTWGYILSTWFMRLFTATPLSRWVDEKNADKWLLFSGFNVVFVAALAIALPMQKGADGISQTDRLLCAAFPGKVCNRVADLSRNETAKLSYILKACAGGVTQQCFERADEQFGVDNVLAVRLLKNACQGGDAPGCTYLGYMIENGLGVDPDPIRAVSLYTKACDDGNARGCANLGIMFDEGRDVDRDPDRAVSLYTKACDGGDANGCTNLGFMFDEGRSVDRDPGQAVSLYTKGCDGGDANGCTNLGFMFEKGRGVDRDPDRAVTLYTKACDGGNARGCANLGFMFEKGVGVEKDLSSAQKYYQTGCNLGLEVSCTFVK